MECSTSPTVSLSSEMGSEDLVVTFITLVYVACVYGFLSVVLDHLQNPCFLLVKTSSTGTQYDGVLWIFSMSSLWLSKRAVKIASNPVVLQFQSGSPLKLAH